MIVPDSVHVESCDCTLRSVVVRYSLGIVSIYPERVAVRDKDIRIETVIKLLFSLYNMLVYHFIE